MSHLPGLETFPPELSELVRKSEGLPLVHFLRTVSGTVWILVSNLYKALHNLTLSP